MTDLTAVLLLVALATAVATGARHWRIPAPSLLVIAGIGVGLLPWVRDFRVSPQVINLVVLPPLLYASAEEISWRELRRVWRPVTVLAFGLVLASAAAVGAVAAAITPLSGTTAFVLGAVLASTDPVAVTALGRRLALPPRVQMMVQAESLFNDATSLVLFKVAVGTAVAGGALSGGTAAGEFVLLGGGGALVGAVVAGLVALIRRRTEDPVLETVIALVTPYAAYVLAEDVHASGVTAVVVAGVVLGGQAQRLTNAPIRLQVHAVYGTVVFLLESVVFAIIGLELPSLIRDLGAEGHAWPLQALAVAGTLLTVRMLWVFPLSAAMQRRRGIGPVTWRVPAVLSWAGTRGVLPLAAALSIPLTAHDGTPLPQRELVLVLTTAVVVFTLVLQGFTLAPVVRRSGIALEPAHTEREEANARDSLARAGLTQLEQLAELEAAPEVVVDQLRRGLQARLDHARAQLDEAADPADSTATAYRAMRRALIEAESAELQRLYDEHRISDTTRRRIQRTLDLEDVGLGE
ncbi:Na+/H+ antiporter [Actinacidiphila oryziradicis]|jgi:CPA1 family monovalent cation:H+ antiporter|uniref:Na+/H+ antiporter n=1 Tax=Actinacidiphila oryziradicis TaxID=2571141 RepID=UPI0023F2F576|nr:Na+/H+ antiporter [Actinacidiphila oryziradicis]MCW2870242.1 sodium/hydrogen exchanger [Actinacidiphila oryziradicis]